MKTSLSQPINPTPSSNCNTPCIYIYLLVEVLFNVGRKGAIVTFGGSRPPGWIISAQEWGSCDGFQTRWMEISYTQSVVGAIVTDREREKEQSKSSVYEGCWGSCDPRRRMTAAAF